MKFVKNTDISVWQNLRRKLPDEELKKCKFAKFSICDVSEIEDDEEVVAETVEKCKVITSWNCSKSDRRFDRCLADRCIFCCGYETANFANPKSPSVVNLQKTHPVVYQR